MRFRVLRSKAFWLGVPGLVFLGWAWVDSFSIWGVVLCDPPGAAAVGSSKGLLFGWKQEGVGVNWGSAEAWNGVVNERDEPVAFLRENPGIELLIVPYAVVVGVYVLAWAGLLVWRARKYRQVPVAEGEA